MDGVRIWFNGIWPSRMFLIPMLRDNPDHAPVRIYGTHSDPAAPALGACDHTGTEPGPEAGDEEFSDFAIDFCRRHRIDAVMPSARIAALAERTEALAEIGTKVMCSRAGTIRLLADKARTYAAVEGTGVPLAPWQAVSDADGLRKAVEEMSEPGGRDRGLCVKPAGEFSASGFRLLDDAPLEIADLRRPARPREPVDAVAGALRRAGQRGESVPELIVMPYLDPPEISVDCLSDTKGTLVAGIARAKEDRLRTLLDDPRLTQLARKVIARFGIAYLSNVQLRHWRGRPVLLEINARASAGIYQTGLSGVNLAWAALRMLLHGDPGDLPAPRLGGQLVVVQHAIAVSTA